MRTDAPQYKAEKWTIVIPTAGPEHEVWAVVNTAGEPVAFGSEKAMRQYATLAGGE